MPISFVGAGTAVGVPINSTSVSVSVPAGLQNGDFLIFVVAGGIPTSVSSGSVSAALIRSNNISIYVVASANASITSYTVAYSSISTIGIVRTFAYRGVNYVDVSTNESSAVSTSISTPTVSTNYSDEYVVSVFSARADQSATWTAPASTTVRGNTSQSSTVRGLLVVDAVQAAAGMMTARTATISANSSLTAMSFSLYAKDRYWVGGSGTWDGTAGSKWAFSSGGASGAPIPNERDDVFLNAASGTNTVTIGAPVECRLLNCTGFTGTLNDNVSGGLSLQGGGFTFASGMTVDCRQQWAVYSAATLISAGKSVPPLSIQAGAGNTVTQGDAFTFNASANATYDVLDVVSGNYNTGNFNITVAGTNGGIQAIGNETRTLTLGSSTITGSTSASDIFTYTGSGLTLSAGTSTILSRAPSGTFSGNGLTFSTVRFSSVAGTITITGANTFSNLTFDGRSTTGNNSFIFNSNQTVSGTFTVGASTSAITRTTLRSNSVSLRRTLTCATVAALTDVDFRDIGIAGAASPVSGTRLGNCGNNTGVTFPGAKTVYWNLAGSNSSTATGWATTSGGTPAVNNFPLAQDTIIVDGNSAGTQLTFADTFNYGAVNLSGRSTAFTIAFGGGSCNFFGNWTGSSSITYGGTEFLVQFIGPNNQTLLTAGRTWRGGIQKTGAGTLTLQDAFTSNNLGQTIVLSSGGFDAAGYAVSIGGFSSTTSETRTLALGTGTWTLNSSGTNAWSVSGSGLTVTGTCTINTASASAKTFAGGGNSYSGVTLNQSGAGTLTITGSNTFANLTNAYGATGATTIEFTSGTTNNFAAFTAAGTAAKLLSLKSVTAGSRATINYTGAGNVSLDYLDVQDISFTPGPAANGSTPYRWYLGENSVNDGNNLGGAFTVSTNVIYQITNTATTSWTVPADWRSDNNTVYLIGGGGGGGSGTGTTASANRSGGGGGGGGYRSAKNFVLTPSSSISVAVGAAGVGGASGANGTAGGNTTLNAGALVAGGGGGGLASGGAAPPGGAGGTGDFVGGTGGAGISTGSYGGSAGGGGGGAAGPLGNGGSGGAGFFSATNSQAAGGGGGGNGGGSAGTAGAINAGGAGGNNASGAGGGTSNGGNGSFGGGGGGGGNNNGIGSVGIEILNTIGSGGGAGGGRFANAIDNTEIYGGGGGGGGGFSSAFSGNRYAGGDGGQGVIIIQYSTLPPASGSFLMFT